MADATIVMKFGGSSVADAELLRRAAERIVARREEGHRVVAVLSARGKETDRLIEAAVTGYVESMQRQAGVKERSGLPFDDEIPF